MKTRRNFLASVGLAEATLLYGSTTVMRRFRDYMAVAGGPTHAPLQAQHPPECDRPTECRFVAGGRTKTAAYCTDGVVYNRNGDAVVSPISPPISCNTTTIEWSCQTCGKHWTETDRG